MSLDFFDDAVSWFERNASTGALTYTENQSTYTVAEEDLGAVITVVASRYLDAGGADENVQLCRDQPGDSME